MSALLSNETVRITHQKMPSKFLVVKTEMGCTRPLTCLVTDTPESRMRRRAAISRKSAEGERERERDEHGTNAAKKKRT